MRTDSTASSQDGQGGRERAGKGICLLLAVGLGMLFPGGGGGDVATPPSASSIDQAFRLAHPGGAVPPWLRRAGAARGAAELLTARAGSTRILLPDWLPLAFGLAAPYIGTGSGSVLPNPQVWHGGYRVSYTDGRGLVVVHVGSGRLPGDGPWLPLMRRWHGASVWSRAAGGFITVAVRERDMSVGVAVAGLPLQTALRVLDGLRAQDDLSPKGEGKP